MLAQVRIFPRVGKYRSLLGDFSSRTKFVLKIPNRPRCCTPLDTLPESSAKAEHRQKQETPPESEAMAFGRYSEPIKAYNSWSGNNSCSNLQSLPRILLPDGCRTRREPSLSCPLSRRAATLLPSRLGRCRH